MPGVPTPTILVPLLRDQPDFSALRDPAAWPQIKAAASAAGLGPSVAFAIRAEASAEQRQWCDQVLVRSWNRHDANLRHLDHILSILQNAGVEALALKGPVLARRYFDPPFLRKPSSDLDLAVRDRDLERATAALSTEGFVATSPVSVARSISHHLALRHETRPLVELHTRLSHATRGIPVDSLFTHALAHQLPGGRTVGILAPADELLGLLLHYAHDRFASFFHLFELRKVWRASSAEVQNEVLARAVAARFSAALWLTDVAFRTYWNEPFLPPTVRIPRTWLQRRLNAELLHALEENVLVSNQRTLGLRLRGRWLDLHVTDTPAEAMRELLLIAKVTLNEAFRGRWGTVRGRLGQTASPR